MSSPLGGIYSSTKHALEAITDSLRMETSGQGISVSLIQPALVATEIMNKENPNKFWAPKLEGEMLRLYQPFVDFVERSDAANLPLSSPPAASSAVIIDAITSSYPKTRYQCANFGGIPGWAIVIIKGVLSDRVYDFVVIKAADNLLPMLAAISSFLVVVVGVIRKL